MTISESQFQFFCDRVNDLPDKYPQLNGVSRQRSYCLNGVLYLVRKEGFKNELKASVNEGTGAVEFFSKK